MNLLENYLLFSRPWLTNCYAWSLSKENNFPELAYKTVVDTLLENHCEENKVSLSVAMRGSTSKMIDLE